MGRPAVTAVTLVLLMGAVVSLQAIRDRSGALALPVTANDQLLYVSSPQVMRRAALSYRAFTADVYWIRAVQHFGSTSLSTDPHKQYQLLFPFLDITTTLDPEFTLAYRLGAMFLAEPFPKGPGRTDLAIALLKKGLSVHPQKWEYAEDIGFVHYWWRHDYASAAEWFRRAGAMTGAPEWLNAVAAITLAQGGNRDSARRLWEEMANTDAAYLQQAARLRLAQLDAMDQMDALDRVVRVYQQRTGTRPRNWYDLGRAGLISRTPQDPTGAPYRLNPDSGAVTLDPASRLNPLPVLHPPPPVR
jgi:hypothetical protein